MAAVNMFKIFKHSHFPPHPFGHGGTKRTAQINELLSRAGIDFQAVDLKLNFPNVQKPFLYLKGVSYSKNIRHNIKASYATGRYLRFFEEFLKTNKPDLFIWESTVEYFLLLPEICKRFGIPVVALPHNLESLVAGTKDVFSQAIAPDWLLQEAKRLSYCNKVFTISREESWLLANCGINASCLPYYPASDTKAFLEGIRARRGVLARSEKKEKEILLLGTFHNKPTAQGFIELIDHIRHAAHITIHVAGYGAEQYGYLSESENVKVWGGVDNEKLSELILQSDYAVVHQQPSSGALTRIPELLIAGLPVLANTHAARSYYDYSGVTVYHSYNDLLNIIDKQPPAPIAPLPEPAVEERLFIDYIKSFIR